jgi:hypothetical protein
MQLKTKQKKKLDFLFQKIVRLCTVNFSPYPQVHTYRIFPLQYFDQIPMFSHRICYFDVRRRRFVRRRRENF